MTMTLEQTNDILTQLAAVTTDLAANVTLLVNRPGPEVDYTDLANQIQAVAVQIGQINDNLKAILNPPPPADTATFVPAP